MATVFNLDASRGTVGYRVTGNDGQEVVREFWVPTNGGAVREESAGRYGSLGVQMCHKLTKNGCTLSATRETLLALIKREVRCIVAAERKNS